MSITFDVADAVRRWRELADRLDRIADRPYSDDAGTRELDRVEPDLAYLFRECREAGLFTWYGGDLAVLIPHTRIFDAAERRRAGLFWRIVIQAIAVSTGRIPGGIEAGGNTEAKPGVHRLDPTRWRSRADDYAAACRILADEAAPAPTPTITRKTAAEDFTAIADELAGLAKRFFDHGVPADERHAIDLRIWTIENDAGRLAVEAHRAGYLTIAGLDDLVAWLEGDGTHPSGLPDVFVPCAENVWHGVVNLVQAAYPDRFNAIGLPAQRQQQVSAPTDAASRAHGCMAAGESLKRQGAAARQIAALLTAAPAPIPDAPPAQGAATADDDEATSAPALTKNERLVLVALARFDAAVLASIEDIHDAMDPAERLSLRAIGPAVNKLIANGLAERPEGDRQGARLTIKGRRLASKIAD